MKLLILLLIAVCAIAQVVEFADCELRPIGNSGVSGYVRFTRDSSSPLVTVNAMVNGIPSGTPSVAIHVHNWGDVSDTAAGNSAGGHYVGAGSTTHACPPAAVRHEGDMGNWNVSGSSISGSKTLDLLTMTGASSILGRAVIVHAKAEDCVTQPTGAAGSRLAQCVIGLGNMTTIGATGSNAAAVSAGTSPLTLAVCDLTSSTSSLTDPHGSVYFQVQNDGVRILGKFTGVNGTHGLHVHTSGDLSMANFVSAGGHWNPKNVSHGLPPHSRHAGDLGNVQTYDGSTAWYDWVNPDYKDLESLIGRAVIFHATFDHGAGYGCDQAGSAGPRMLSCVIGVGNATAVVLPTPPPVDNKYKDVDCSARPKKKKNRTGVIVGLSVTFGVLLIVIVVAVILVKCVWQSSSSMGDASYQSLPTS